MEKCIFCEIVKGNAHSMKVYEDEFTLAFMDIAKDVDGHILVIPKKHCENILDCDYEALGKTMDTVKKVSIVLPSECGYDGVDILNANGRAAGQTVPHFHMHIIPRKHYDGLGEAGEWPIFPGAKYDIETIHKKVMMLKLVRPTLEMKQAALEFKKEFLDNGEKVINGSEMLDNMDSYEEWLSSVTNNTSPDTVNQDWVVTDTFFAVDGNEKIVGIIDLRHTLNDFLKDFGNSGYSVRPSERRKGYATKMLAMIKQVAKEAGLRSLQLSVERDNEPSVKTIVNNGGIYERSFEVLGELADVYMVEL